MNEETPIPAAVQNPVQANLEIKQEVPVQDKQKSNKNVIILVIVFLLLLPIVAYGAFTFGEQKGKSDVTIPAIEQSPTVTSDPISTQENSDLTTYENKKFGFSLMYPSTFNVTAEEFDIQAAYRD